jgi:microcystin-dependent protein
MPVGELKFVAFPFAPKGWVNCAGQLLAVADYPDLFAAIGTTFGGDGKTTFALPNATGRMLLGKHDALAVGNAGGVASGTNRLPYLAFNCITPAIAGADDYPQPFYGEIRVFGGSWAPAGWAVCDGREIRIPDNPTLFNLIQNTFGGNGSTTFRLPDLRGRVLLGAGKAPSGTQYGLGATGTESVAGAQGMPVHYLISIGGVYPFAE